MARLLFLAHRVPVPPTKGDKVRSYHLLRHLAAQHEVEIATFAEQETDAELAELAPLCAQSLVLRRSRRDFYRGAWRGLISGAPLSLSCFEDPRLSAWVRQRHAQVPFDAVFGFSSAVGPYAQALGLPLFMDFVDVDSAKWQTYAQRSRPWRAWLYRREARLLRAFEQRLGHDALHAYFVSERERGLFLQGNPDLASRVQVLGNGVDAEQFSPDPARPNPFPPDVVPVVMTGTMDYLPNVDGARWFAEQVLPLLRVQHPRVQFFVVGRNPGPRLHALDAASDAAVHVVGTVPDVRPYLQHAAVVVAPIRMAQGVQNKVLEAMAMARPVVTTSACQQALTAVQPTEELVAADGETAFALAVSDLLKSPVRAEALGARARWRVQRSYTWSDRFTALDAHLAALHVSKDVDS